MHFSPIFYFKLEKPLLISFCIFSKMQITFPYKSFFFLYLNLSYYKNYIQYCILLCRQHQPPNDETQIINETFFKMILRRLILCILCLLMSLFQYSHLQNLQQQFMRVSSPSNVKPKKEKAFNFSCFTLLLLLHLRILVKREKRSWCLPLRTVDLAAKKPIF